MFNHTTGTGKYHWHFIEPIRSLKTVVYKSLKHISVTTYCKLRPGVCFTWNTASSMRKPRARRSSSAADRVLRRVKVCGMLARSLYKSHVNARIKETGRLLIARTTQYFIARYFISLSFSVTHKYPVYESAFACTDNCVSGCLVEQLWFIIYLTLNSTVRV